MISFTISTDTAIERGIVGRAELPELLSFFKAAAHGHSAKTTLLAGGLMIAERDERFVTLSITHIEHTIPSRSVFECLEDAMARAYSSGVSESLQNSEEMGLPQWPSIFNYD